jgi:hypothetical protein
MYFLISFSQGIFMIYGNLSSSSLTNSTFTKITAIHTISAGGALIIYTPNTSSITISHCIFTQCKAEKGGALYLKLNTPYIYINHTRFENNSADYGDDICVENIPCLNLAKSDSLDSSVCSITPLNNRVYCYSNGLFEKSQLKTCSKEVV